MSGSGRIGAGASACAAGSGSRTGGWAAGRLPLNTITAAVETIATHRASTGRCYTMGLEAPRRWAAEGTEVAEKGFTRRHGGTEDERRVLNRGAARGAGVQPAPRAKRGPEPLL